MSGRADGQILRSLGLMLQREEHTARPVPVSVAGVHFQPIIHRQCAWCQRWLGVRPVESQGSAGFITHSICPSCAARVRADLFGRAVTSAATSERVAA